MIKNDFRVNHLNRLANRGQVCYNYNVYLLRIFALFVCRYAERKRIIMNKFPEKLKGKALSKLHRETADVIPEEKIKYYRKMFEAIANFYGVISLKKVYEILTENYNEELTEETFLKLCEFFRYEQQNYAYIFSEDEYYETDTYDNTAPIDRYLAYDPFVWFEDSYEALKELKEGKPWYIPPQEYMLSFAQQCRIEKNEPYDKFINFISEEFDLSRSDAEHKADDAVFSIRNESHTFDSFLNELQRMGIEPEVEQVKKIAPYFVEMNNSIRMAANNGYTPAEMKKICDESGLDCKTFFIDKIEIDENHEKNRSESFRSMKLKLSEMSRMLDKYSDDNSINLNLPVKSRKIGRNEPCPCGSGKKYKKCCGR